MYLSVSTITRKEETVEVSVEVKFEFSVEVSHTVPIQVVVEVDVGIGRRDPFRRLDLRSRRWWHRGRGLEETFEVVVEVEVPIPSGSFSWSRSVRR